MKNWLLFICLLATLQLATNQISSPVQLTHSFETRPLDADFPSPIVYYVFKDSFDYGSGLGIANVNPAGRGFEQGKHKATWDFRGFPKSLPDFLSPIDYDFLFKDSFDYVTRPELVVRPVDCCDIKRNSHRQLKSGKYTIYPPTAENNAVEVYCDMDTEGGGWTVFLSRDLQKNEVNFTREWIQYRDGFGTPDEEYWLGNENLHALTQSRQNVLRLEYSGRRVSNLESESFWGEWFTFSVASNAEKYNLTVMDPNLENTASNEIIDNHNGMLFTTYDEDNDSYTNRNCADLYKGGWWYNNCYKINPTGRHYYEDKTDIRVEKWSKEIPIPGYAHRLQLKMRIPVCDLPQH